MKKFLIGAAAAALTVGTAAPAEAQYRDYDRRSGIDTGDIIAGVAVIGGIAAILAALDRDGDRYGYDSRYRHRDSYSAAVNACGYEAERYGRGRVRITDVDRRSRDRYRVEGVVESSYGYEWDRGYDRRYDARDYRRNYGDRFTCTAYGNGRIAEFRMRDGGYASRW
ncbi:MAG: hypothetical protein M3N07_01765 [Pseudomonadota bacterium]|nr:hypothetical protein [Pseudomonadota bacterium]